ncbi:SnoaL-like polyketide cyclase [Acetobacter musti]|uniref:SnoaL-like polyketide cyclase n=1 Tax=Acetobacter musti TaxID=864732 RepID=A0ABX0JSZ6_9PROT|nr:SnoaL-like polyketide cyclase [Acetobacter musti]NHN85070.1 SnoaL-like polyketide cyclase [Acetobacter musti]
MSESAPLWLQDREAVIEATPENVWRYGAPSYAFTNKRLADERQMHFEPGSLEETITNLVRVFEMEATNKANPEDWISIDPKVFRMTVNGSREYTVQDLVAKGGYNLFIGDRANYNASESNYEKSEAAFHNAFRTGFLWELLTLKAHLPTATLTWRHWGLQNGEFNGHKGDGTLLDIHGATLATLNDELKITRLEHYFDAGGMIDSLSGGCPIAH